MIHSTVVGNLGGDAELKVLQSGDQVLSFSMAARGKKKDSPPIWVRGSIWGKRAEALAKYLTKGTKVTAVGRLTTHEHEGKTYLDLDVQEIEFSGPKKDGETPSDLPF